jgi:hypothetical protein
LEFGLIGDDMNNVFKTMMTGKDNHTHDIAKWAWLGGFLAIIGAAIYEIAMGHSMSLMEIATSLGIVSGSGAASVAGKQLSGAEPDPK